MVVRGRRDRRRLISGVVAVGCAVLAIGWPLAAPASGAVVVPAGFTEQLVAGTLSQATSMEFAPDGRLFVTQQAGRVRVIKNGALLTTPFVNIPVATGGTRGLMSVTFDPAFATNQFVYVYYTASTPTVHNRVSRFTANGDVAVPGSELVLLDLPPTPTQTINHDGGDMHFGPDGKLYITTGDNLQPSNSQSTSTLFGKVLRMNPDGSIPADNPFYGSATGANRLIYALGLRNPFKFTFQPGTGRMRIGDVGADTWEEVNEGGAASNFGWPTTEGPTSAAGITGPVWAYQHDSGTPRGCAIGGGAFYNPTTVAFPSSYLGDYFVTDYCGGWIWRLDAADGSANAFATGLEDAVDLKVGNDGAVYYLSRANGGQVRRIVANGGGATAPTITSQPQGQTVAVGASATFSVAASGSTPLAYRWQRNGSNISGATASSYTLPSAAASDDGASFRVVVSNSAGTVTSAAAILDVVTSAPPSATITEPAGGTTYGAGDTIHYAGTANDPETGPLGGGSFTWRVDFHHDTHVHPFVPPSSGATSGSFSIPAEGETSPDVWYRVILTTEDPDGVTTTTFRDVVPRTSTMTFTSDPPGLRFTLDGVPTTTPTTVTGVEGIRRRIGAVEPQAAGGRTYSFAAWSDGGAATHDVATPVADTTFEVTYADTGPAPTEAALVVGSTALSPADQILRARLEAAGLSVAVVDDSQIASIEAPALVLVSPTANGAAGPLRTIAVPVVLSEPWMFDDLGMTGGSASSRGQVSNQRAIAVSDPAHPLIAGRTGTVTVTSAATGFGWGVPNGNAARVATVSGDPTRSTVFGYEAGVVMAGGNTSPARRIGLFLLDPTAASLTPDGLAILDAAIAWALEGSIGPANHAPIAAAGPDSAAVVGDLVTLDGSGSTDVDGDPLTYQWTHVGGPPMTIEDADSPNARFRPTAEGEYVCRLRVSDGELAAIDDVTVAVRAGGGGGRAAAFVVGDPAAMNASDVAIRQRLESSGFAVTVVDDSAALTVDTRPFDLVVLSASTSTANVGVPFRDDGVGLLVTDGFTFDDVGMTRGTDPHRGQASGQTRVRIANASHPLAAGLSGSPVVTATATSFAFGVPSSSATIAATLNSDATRATVFGYEPGAVMQNGVIAAGRRVGLFLGDNGGARLTADGIAMLDAAIAWAAA